METEQISPNNNHGAPTQGISSTPYNSLPKEFGSRLYICSPRMRSFFSMKPLQRYENVKLDANLNSNETPSKMPSKFEDCIDEPIDLTCAEKRESETTTNNTFKGYTYKTEPDNAPFQSAQNSFNLDYNCISKRGRKKKYVINNLRLQKVPTLEPGLLKILDNANSLQVPDSRQAEVLKAAKSLFSKRTRTLYHWMYPNAPKAQLKAAVATSWETLGEQEKEFYISQVLGRFGFPQTNLMVNPQLGGLAGVTLLPPLDFSNTNQEETSSAISSILLNERGSCASWSQPSVSSIPSRPAYTQRINRKRGRHNRLAVCKSKKSAREEFSHLKQFGEDATTDEFQDDPELNRELQQFKWTLHLNDNRKS